VRWKEDKRERELYEGLHGVRVLLLQQWLNRYSNAGLVEDGYFGRKTFNAVVNWQNKYGITNKGIVGIDFFLKMLQLMDNIKRLNLYWIIIKSIHH
jgi:peptidoglycan hydrolase-like protein with peptidoglycan-binding domain